MLRPDIGPTALMGTESRAAAHCQRRVNGSDFTVMALVAAPIAGCLNAYSSFNVSHSSTAAGADEFRHVFRRMRPLATSRMPTQWD